MALIIIEHPLFLSSGAAERMGGTTAEHGGVCPTCMHRGRGCRHSWRYIGVDEAVVRAWAEGAAIVLIFLVLEPPAEQNCEIAGTWRLFEAVFALCFSLWRCSVVVFWLVVFGVCGLGSVWLGGATSCSAASVGVEEGGVACIGVGVRGLHRVRVRESRSGWPSFSAPESALILATHPLNRRERAPPELLPRLIPPILKL